MNATRTPIRATIPVESGVGSTQCGPRALCGWSPAPLPADTTFKRRVDLIRGGNFGAVATFAVVVGLLNLAPHFPLRGDLAVVGLAALAGGGWCSLNFWRCRHAHCLVSGPGWLAFGVFAFVEAGLGRSLIGGNEQPVFFGLLGLALAFERRVVPPSTYQRRCSELTRDRPTPARGAADQPPDDAYRSARL